MDANFNTDATRAGRSIAGLSMGGLGALTYAGRHPDLFSAVGSFSGATNIRLQDAATGGAANMPPTIGLQMRFFGACILYPQPLDNCLHPAQSVTAPFGTDQDAYAMSTLFGPESDYPNLNPWDLAGRYAAYDGLVGLYSGGLPSGERDLYAHARSLHDELTRRGVPHHWCVGAGAQNWGHWAQDLTDFLNLVYAGNPTCHHVAS